MNTIRLRRRTVGTYLAAFLLGALIALILALPTRAAQPAPLDRIAVVRFTAEPDGSLRQQNAILHDDGRLSLRASATVARPANFPADALGRTLISAEAWAAYFSLGFDAVRRFELQEGSVRVPGGTAGFYFVGHRANAALTDGTLANVSTRVHVAPAAGQDHATAGFVIEGRPRTVLVRAVGPTLQRFGIGAWLRDPTLVLRPTSGPARHANDNWSAAANLEEIRLASARVGAFALDEASGDSALLVELPPGAYTAVVQSAAAAFTGGDVLIEVYLVPAD